MSRVWKIALIAAVVIAGGAFVAMFLKNAPVKENRRSDASAASEAKIKTTPPTPSEYELAASGALREYLASRATFSEDLGDVRGVAEILLARSAIDALSKIIVPTERRETHLKLVLALAQIEEGIASKDKKLWQKGEVNLDKYLEENSWLKSESR